jgi:hypothetical protein
LLLQTAAITNSCYYKQYVSAVRWGRRSRKWCPASGVATVYLPWYVFCTEGTFQMLSFLCTLFDAELLARSQYSEGPATGHLDTGFSRFPCVYKQTLRRFPTFQVATTCFSCSPPDLNFLVTNFIFCVHVK